ncbi:MAG: hypothetical protein MUC42_10015 [Bryobacter sp.]|nr:hypothetical protein [Bryobacter sp.]
MESPGARPRNREKYCAKPVYGCPSSRTTRSPGAMPAARAAGRASKITGEKEPWTKGE